VFIVITPCCEHAVRQVNYRFNAGPIYGPHLTMEKLILGIVHETSEVSYSVIVFVDRHSSPKSADQNRCKHLLSFQFKSLMLAGTQNQVTKILCSAEV